MRQHFGLDPEDAMDEDIEESARFFEEDNGELHIRSDFLIDDADEPRSVRVAFILNQPEPELNSHGVLFSIHDEDVPVFRLLRLRARRMPGLISTPRGAAAPVRHRRRILRRHGRRHLRRTSTRSAARCWRQRDRRDGRRGAGRDRAPPRHVGRIRRNVMDTRRAVSFMMRTRMLSAEQFEDAPDPARHRFA